MTSYDIIGVDAETYSPTDIRKGLVNYFDDPEFKVLLISLAMETETGVESAVIDMTEGDYEYKCRVVERAIGDSFVVAHNAMFEFFVLHKMGIHLPASKFIDSAVVSRIAGLGGSLEAAAPQGLNVDKMPSGKKLIQLFSIPGTYQMENKSLAWDRRVVEDHEEEWDEFARYCGLDSALSYRLFDTLNVAADEFELLFSAVTMEMNTIGWKVDLPLVEAMQAMYMDNVAEAVAEFEKTCDAEGLNLSSTVQLIAWCKERGVRATSFDEMHVAKMLTKMEAKLAILPEDDAKREGYEQVAHLLRTKQMIGGSSLRKLRTILDQTARDGRLYDQYLHAGAGQTLRTTGRGVQMQNLKRLGQKPDDVQELLDGAKWSNEKLARNLRQVFTASATPPHGGGRLIVGDFSAVESRGLAWQAGEDWKLDAYRHGKDVYLEQAARFFGKDAADATKEDRTFGKVGELSCGYQAGWSAVKDFSEKMGIILTEGEAKKLVFDFRTTNPKTVAYWAALQSAMEEAMEFGTSLVQMPHGKLQIHTTEAIDSLQKQTEDGRLKTMVVRMHIPGGRGAEGDLNMTRIFHGVHREGTSFLYWKPSERKTGDLWVPDYTDPKTGARRSYSIYGGKLAGILTQSLCRELFMQTLLTVDRWLRPFSNVKMVGQFHDEIVLDWAPPATVLDPTLEEAEAMLEKIMSTTTLPGFPLSAEVHSDYRYIK